MRCISSQKHTDVLDINITPCYSFQVSNNEISFINDECKGNAHQTTATLGSFPSGNVMDTWCRCCLSWTITFPLITPSWEGKPEKEADSQLFSDCLSAFHRMRCSKNIWREMLERNLLRPHIFCISSQSHALAIICTPSPMLLVWSTPHGGKRSTTVLISRGSLNSLLQFCLVIFKVLKIKKAFYCALYKQSAPSGKVN